MTTKGYLLELEENVRDDSFVTRHLIIADSAQMVKYHFHKTLKDWGYRDTTYDKHYLTRDRLGAEILSIRPLKPHEFEVLDEYINRWTKV